ncbi:MAG TPA: GrpB family protein [Thermoleophilaceae bacterium]
MNRDVRNAELDEILIGGREPARITIVDYNPAWPARFEWERARILRALGDGVAVRIEHFGSTAVPGLAAKPIVDLIVTVANADDEAAFVPALEHAGYELRVREPGHRMFRVPTRDVHVHVWADGDPEVQRSLALRDRLRASPEDRASYERLKRELAERDWDDMNHYADAKDELIGAILSRSESSHGVR